MSPRREGVHGTDPHGAGRRPAAAIGRRVAMQAALGRAWAQPAFPVRPVTIRVGVPAGGPADNAVRSAQPMLQRLLGQPVVVENLPGASGTLAVRSVLAAAPDGHTLLAGPGADFLVAPFVMPAAKYAPQDFRLVGVTGVSDFLLVARSGLGIASLEALLAQLSRTDATPPTLAHWGAASAPHLVGADFAARTGARFTEIPYKGAAPVLSDLVGGQVDLAFVPLTGQVLAMLRSQRIVPLGVSASTRHPMLPAVPALAEAPALRGFEHSVWSAVLAPPATPDAALQVLTDALGAWIVSPDSLARLASNASRPVPARTLDENAGFLRTEQAKHQRIARALKLQPAS
ncbi:tripartite tricarboxylate transporter substrate binding protein [Piscinibacter sakaiensis]|uniref:tripartite tricarboxylate transporter substrate binding protein n=1 Tax=Piscinibacter sakaiensis TaxID=1547922 RepID=UPI003727D16B